MVGHIPVRRLLLLTHLHGLRCLLVEEFQLFPVVFLLLQFPIFQLFISVHLLQTLVGILDEGGRIVCPRLLLDLALRDQFLLVILYLLVDAVFQRVAAHLNDELIADLPRLVSLPLAAVVLLGCVGQGSLPLVLFVARRFV